MVTISKIQDICGFSNYLFEQFLDNNIGIDMIIQNEYQNEGKFNDFTFVINKSEVDRMMVILLKIKAIYNFFDVQLKSDIAKISIVGMKMINESGIASDVFKVLLLHSINIFAVSTSDIKISLIIKADYTELAIRVLHDKFI